MAQNTVIRLWRNRESRAVIMQIIVVLIVFSLFGYLGYNAKVNLDAVDQGIDYSFMSQTAGYDIHSDQQLIAYDSTDTHGRAALVGLLNTLKVAVLGIIAATIIGFIVGVMRLSPNYLIAGISRVYVEGFRNVPVLLWILLFHGVIVNALPVPKAALNLGDMVFFTNRGFYFPSPQFESVAIWSALACLIGIGFSIWYYQRARKIQIATGHISPVLWVSLGAIIGLPLIVFLLSGVPLSWDIPAKKGFNFAGGMVVKPEFLALWGSLSLYTSAFIAENVRGGIQAISHGQTEAAFALGIRRNRTMQLVIIPQAMRVIVPPLTSQYLNLTKNSSLAIAVGYMDVVATLGGITLNQTGRAMESMSLVLLIYLSISLSISLFMNWYNKRIKLVER